MNSKRWNKSRRDFLMKSMTGITSISLLPSLLKGESKAKEETKYEGKKKIITRTLGRTGFKVPIVSVGCGDIDIPQLVRAALDAGVVLFHTAPGYVGGSSETIIGEALKGRPRDSFVIATKSGISIPSDTRRGLLLENIRPAELRSSFRNTLDRSLQRLQLDYLDILFSSGNNPEEIGLKVVKDMLLEVKKEGKVRFLGIHFHQNEPAIIRATVQEKIYDVILTSYNFRQPHREEVKKAIAYAAKAGLGVVAMKVMAGVYWDKERKKPINAKAALKWVLQDENVHTIIPGISTFDQLETNMSVMEDLSFTPQEKEDLRFGEKIGMNGLYCPQCGRCRSQCHYHLNIPTLMRSYMYAYGYRNSALAKETLQAVDLPNAPCVDCHTCTVTCAMGFDVRNRIMDIARLNDVPKDFLV